MKVQIEEKNKFRSLKRDTRQWSSGRVQFSVIGIPGETKLNYIVFEKDFFGNQHPPQRFILRLHDWENLKKLVDGELNDVTEWKASVQPSRENIEKLIQENPELLEVVLKMPNITNLSQISLEALDRLSLRVFDIKRENVDLILKRLEEARAEELLTFASLLKDLKLNQISTLSNLVYQKLKIIELLEVLTAEEKSSERKVHQLFESHIWLCGKNYEIVQSEKSLAQYLEKNVPSDPEMKRRPDLIVKRIPHTQDLILIELKAPGVKLRADHIGQVLSYRALIEKNKPSVGKIHCFLYGHEKAPTFTMSNDVTIKTFSELISELRDEYAEYQKVLEAGGEVDEPEQRI